MNYLIGNDDRVINCPWHLSLSLSLSLFLPLLAPLISEERHEKFAKNLLVQQTYGELLEYSWKIISVSMFLEANMSKDCNYVLNVSRLKNYINFSVLFREHKL